MRLPKNLKIHVCSECNGTLADADFKCCGVFLQRRALFFDYKCTECDHVGRYVFEMKEDVSTFEGIRAIAAMLEHENQTESKQKDNIISQLNSMVGVSDFLKLGGKHAPTEPTRTCE